MLGFQPDELELHVTDEIQSYLFIADDQMDSAGSLNSNRFCMYRLPYNASGMIEVDVLCEEDTELYLVFDEVLHHGDISISRSGCANTVKYTLEKGFYRLHLFEVYTMQYIKVCNIRGKVQVSDLRLIEYKHPPVSCSLPVVHGDSALKSIADAAIETYRQNAVDIFMDCPSRERAGWLCDSFFTGRVERLLTHDSRIEKSFLENFLHAGHYPDIPEGMVPMCYPADHYDGNFIVNWGQWLVLELSEYLDRSGDRDLINRYRPKVYALLDYLKRQENEGGLMENLKGWVFVEWSKANELTQDVNYPSNMLYSLTLKAAGRLYGDDELLQRSETVKQEVLRQSYNGEFFTDNAVRKDGKLVSTNEITEVCQYYAFFCDIASPSTHPGLWSTLLTDFGPERKQTNKYPHVYFANAFIGNYLRLEVMMRHGYRKEVLDNIRGYFLYMADKTGTLWENDSDHASCNHGFASHVLYWLASM